MCPVCFHKLCKECRISIELDTINARCSDCQEKTALRYWREIPPYLSTQKLETQFSLRLEGHA